MIKRIRIATRSSPLAMWQARFVAKQIKQQHPRYQTEIIPITANADKDLQTPLYSMGNIGVFAKEVHAHILSGHADIGVHSCKDLPTESPQGISIRAICKRHDPRDVLISKTTLEQLKPGAIIGTSSLRRRSQLAQLRNDVVFENIRGNVGTRLKKIEDGNYDATLMAYAGLKRLGIHRSLSLHVLDPYTECCPAPAQGAIAIDCLSERNDLPQLLAPLHHRPSAIAIAIERKVLNGLQGGCSLPLGCLVEQKELRWQLHASLGKDDQSLIKVELQGNSSDLAQRALEQLLG